MKIHFDDIPREGLRVELGDESWFPGNDLKKDGVATVELYLQRQVERVLCQGELSVRIIRQCDRCLVDFIYPISSKIALDYELRKGDDFVDDYICNVAEMDTIYLEEPIIDIFSMLRQQVLLNLPVKAVCSTQCKGLCPCCGTDRNKNTCSCDETVDSPFNILKKIL